MEHIAFFDGQKKIENTIDMVEIGCYNKFTKVS